MQIPTTFAKLNAAGNDFICIDNSDGRFDDLLAADALALFVRHVCRRGLAVGADGVIFASGGADDSGINAVARFFEPDGTEAKLCGNGTACCTFWVVDKGITSGPEVNILTAAGTARGIVDATNPRHIRVCVPNPRNMRRDVRITVCDHEWIVDYVDTGVPHAIAFVGDRLASLDVAHWGKNIRRHPDFAPEGVNANFVQVLGVGKVAIRTFEFGVEAETLACGTGSAAAAIMTALRQGWPEEYTQGRKPVEVTVRSGAKLLVWFSYNGGGNVVDVCLETRVTPVYEAKLSPETVADIKLQSATAQEA